MTSLSVSAPMTYAGAAVVDITPAGSVFLFGYPHVQRLSTGVHDPLECAALYWRVGESGALLIACDLIYFGRDHARAIRVRAAAAARLPVEAVMLTATHTHSGPVMTNNLGNAGSKVVPPADPGYLEWLVGRIESAARAAVAAAEPVECGLVIAKAEGVGTNRHDAAGLADPDVPVLVARSVRSGQPIGVFMVYAMHPTVLHEDSNLITADFPGFTRRALRRSALPPDCPILYALGAAGDQSPRHVTLANTFAEAERIGGNLARTVDAALKKISFGPLETIKAKSVRFEVQPRSFPSVSEAEAALARARAKFHALRAADAPRQEIRTAECDVFGAEKTLVFAGAAADGRLDAAVRSASPAEIQLIQIGPWRFVGWPGEHFVAHGLALKAAATSGTFLVTLANGELQGYIATPEAVAHGAYEATNALFDVANGPRFVERTLALLSSGN
jgi:hypothetical protein